MYPMDYEDLKSIKIQINRKLPHTETVTKEIDYNLPNTEEIAIIRKVDEGINPIFNRTDIKVNSYTFKDEPSSSKAKKDSPTSKTIRSVPDDSINEEFEPSTSKRESIEKETRKHVLQNIDARRARKRSKQYSSSDDDMFTLLKETVGSLKMFDKKPNSKKRNRKTSSTSSSSSPSPKRLRNDYSGKYGHSSKFDNDLFDKSNKYRDCSSPLKHKKKASSDMSDSSSSSVELRRKLKQNRRHKKSKSKSRKYRNNNEDYPPHGMTSSDIEERYYKYYAVMYAFTIILDILRQDGINFNF